MSEPVAWMSTFVTDKGNKLQRLGFTREEAEMANATPVPLYAAPPAGNAAPDHHSELAAAYRRIAQLMGDQSGGVAAVQPENAAGGATDALRQARPDDLHAATSPDPGIAPLVAKFRRFSELERMMGSMNLADPDITDEQGEEWMDLDQEMPLLADEAAAALESLQSKVAELAREKNEAIDGMAHYQVHDYQETKRANAAEARVAELEREVAVRKRDAKSEVWYWQGDGQDFPESLGCPVIMQPETLREMLAECAKLRERIAELENDVHVATNLIKVLPRRLDSAEAECVVLRRLLPLVQQFFSDYPMQGSKELRAALADLPLQINEQSQ